MSQATGGSSLNTKNGSKSSTVNRMDLTSMDRSTLKFNPRLFHGSNSNIHLLPLDCITKICSLRFNHALVPYHLHGIGLSQSPSCACNHDEATTNHYFSFVLYWPHNIDRLLKAKVSFPSLLELVLYGTSAEVLVAFIYLFCYSYYSNLFLSLILYSG